LNIPKDISLASLQQLIANMSPEQRAQLAAKVKPSLEKAWSSQPGPQSDAFYSDADETLYGGAAGGGKTDLIIGLCTTAHRRSLVFRAQSVDLGGFWDRLREVIPFPLTKDDNKRRMVTADNRLIECGHLDKPGSERDWMGRPHDFIAFDEAAQLDELKVEFVMRWLRSTVEGQRKRVLFATNPPMPEIRDGQMVDTGTGDWLLRWFAPWLDDMFPNPAAAGELRWCIMKGEGDRLVTLWVGGPGWYDPQTGEPRTDASDEDKETGRVAASRSRTFIKSLLKDNAFLAGTGYAERLSSTPEPLKSMLLNGDFTVRGEDHPMQIIPTQWVLEAQRRWMAMPEEEILRMKQLVLYGDIAQGGADTTVLAPLMTKDFYDQLITKPGSETPTGKEVAKLLIEERMDMSLIALDGTGGWAGSTAATMEHRYGIICELHTVSKRDGSSPADMPMYFYRNLRAKMWWEFRLALDPKSEFRICLPPGARLRTQLCAPHWKVVKGELIVEEKDDVRKRIGTSTDEADGVLGAWQYREQAILEQARARPDLITRLNSKPEKEYDPQSASNEDYDPRGGW
jgi:hypothetical protein